MADALLSDAEIEVSRETVGDALADRAHDLVDGHRVLVHAGFRVAGERPYEYAYVLGDSGPHLVRASADGVYCDCWGYRVSGRCAHRVAAMIAWGEQAGG